ncbi:hypothetical protein BJ741DRAFT_622473 [Chytriomyces cf. hyalinus JEL632]|nr:hypothetical protein BJ741DRAFT_622473 [Chytriomyces cf. hyalinus JEL632]
MCAYASFIERIHLVLISLFVPLFPTLLLNALHASHDFNIWPILSFQNHRESRRFITSAGLVKTVIQYSGSIEK